MNTEVEAYEKRLTTLNGLCEELTAGNFNEFVNDEAATEARGGRGVGEGRSLGEVERRDAAAPRPRPDRS